jgi:hypothetical protein
MSDDREVFRVRREAGLAKRHETREDRFHERVREVLAEGLADYVNKLPWSPNAQDLAVAGYQALLDAGYVVIPATEEAP